MHLAQHVRTVEFSSANDGRVGRQNVEDSNSRVFRCSNMDIFQRNDQRIYQNVHLGNITFDYQKNE